MKKRPPSSDQLIPRLPVRQWVLSFPIPLPILFAAHREWRNVSVSYSPTGSQCS